MGARGDWRFEGGRQFEISEFQISDGRRKAKSERQLQIPRLRRASSLGMTGWGWGV